MLPLYALFYSLLFYIYCHNWMVITFIIWAGLTIRVPLTNTRRVPSPPLSFSTLPSLPLPLEVGPLNPARGLGNTVSSPSRVWGRAPTEIDFGEFQPLNLTSGGNIFNDFLENQLPKFHPSSADHGVLRAL